MKRHQARVSIQLWLSCHRFVKVNGFVSSVQSVKSKKMSWFHCSGQREGVCHRRWRRRLLKEKQFTVCYMGTQLSVESRKDKYLVLINFRVSSAEWTVWQVQKNVLRLAPCSGSLFGLKYSSRICPSSCERVTAVTGGVNIKFYFYKASSQHLSQGT